VLYHGIDKLAELIVVVVSCHQLRLDNVISVKHNNSAILGGAGRHNNGDTMVLGMNTTLDMDKSSPETACLDNVGRATPETR
jgi:hypothetical protein